ncbi:MAG: hypothetical protein ABIX01_14570 [Chitinophagaceae bacterium]
MNKIYLMVLALGCMAKSFAADYYWIGGVGPSNWSAGSNWSASSGGAAGTLTPAANDKVFFDAGGSVEVNYNIASVGFGDFAITNNTNLTLVNTAAATRTFGINATGTNYYTIVATGSSLTLKSSSSSIFAFQMTSGRAVFNGPVYCINQAANTANGPRMDGSGDSIIINNLLYAGPQIAQLGSSHTGGKFRFGPSAVYQIDRNGGTTVAGNYSKTSLIKLTGTTTTTPTFGAGFNQAYGSVEINTTVASATLNLSFGSGASLLGDFKIVNCGGQIIRWASTVPNPFTIGGDVVVSDGTLQVGNSSTGVTVNIAGKLQVDASKTFDLQASSGNNNVKLSGDLVAPGIITESGSSTSSNVEFGGILNQNLTFGTVSNDVSLKVNSPAGVTLLSNLSLPNSTNSKLSFTNGIISNAGGFTLAIGNPASTALVGGTATSFLNGGKFRRAITNASFGAYIFPAGKAGKFRQVKLYPNTGGANDFTVEYFNNAFGTSTCTNSSLTASATEYWDITRNSGTDAMDISLVTPSNVESGITGPDIQQYYVGHYNGTSWDDFANGGANATTNSGLGTEVVTAGYTGSFSPFTILGSSSILPITLQAFRGIKSNNGNLIDWKVNCTSARINMEIERSTDAHKFSSIYSINADQARCGQPFNFTDGQPLSAVNYYRLKMVDIDGKVSYSSIIAIINNDKHLEFAGLFPTLVSSQALLSLTAAAAGTIHTVIADISGRIVRTATIQVPGGSSSTIIDCTTLANGAYTITGYTNAGKTQTIRFIKN